MLRSMRKARLATVLVLVVVITGGFVLAALPGGVRPVDAQASTAPSGTTVTNNITVSSNSISLGSVLEARGQVSAGSKPLPNASVALHMGDINVANTQTDHNGRYAFSVPVGTYYFPAAFSNGATVYTVVEPHDSSFVDTPSAATSVPVNLAPLFAIIALITAAVVIVCYLLVRRFREKGPAVVGAARPSGRVATLGSLYTRRMRGKAVLGPLRRGRAKPAAEQTVTVTPWASPSEAGALDQKRSAQEITPAADIIAEAPPQEAPKVEPPSPAETTAPLAYETPRTSDTAGAMGEYALRTEHLTKKFEDLTVVDDLNLAIKHREVFGFLGPNGAGKTTSIKMMVGLLQPTSGRVLFNGVELVSMQKRRIGICPQELVLWEAITCRENLTFMGKMYRVEKPLLDNRVNELLTTSLPHRQADQSASKLSGGMKRRLNIALALVHHPEIVFLDEPSAGLDPQTRQLLWNFIRSFRDKEGKTVS